MADVDQPKITVMALERLIDAETGLHDVHVRLGIEAAGGLDSEWSVWIPGVDDFGEAEQLARAELQRVSSLLARGTAGDGAAAPRPSGPTPAQGDPGDE